MLLLLSLMGAGCPSHGPKDTSPSVQDSVPETDDTLETEETRETSDTPETGETAHADTRETARHTGDTHPETAETGDTAEPFDPSLADPWVQPSVWVTPAQLTVGQPATVHYRGALAGSKALNLEYGLNGWREVTLKPSCTEEFLDYERDCIYEAPMTPVAGGFDVTVDLPVGTEVLNMRFRDPTQKLLDDNSDREYHASIPFPYIGPFLTWNATATPGTGVVVSWESDNPCLGVLEHGSSAALGDWSVGTTMDTIHHVEVGGISPGDTLYYRVWDSLGRFSTIHSFTQPDPGAPSFQFLVFSDVQVEWGEGRWGQIGAEMEQGFPSAAFLMVVGDMATSDNPGPWWSFFAQGRDLLASKVILPVPGNHDTPTMDIDLDASVFMDYFDLPYASAIDPWYSLDFGTTHLLMLHSLGSGYMSPGGPEYSFAETDLAGCWLAGVKVCERVFAACHVPPYDAGARHYLEQEEQRPVTALFEGTVDWHFSGHEHLYQRMVPLRFEGIQAPSGNHGTGPSDGVGYMVLPSAGSSTTPSVVAYDDKYVSYRDWLAWPPTDPKGNAVPSELGFVSVDVDPASLSLTAWGVGDMATPQPLHVVDGLSY